MTLPKTAVCSRRTGPPADASPGREVSTAPGKPRLGLPWRHPAVPIATCFGAGLSPFAPGTCGSLAGLVLGWAVRALWGRPGLALAWVFVIAVGWWAAGAVARASGLRDPAAIIVDEVAGQLLVLLAAPPDTLSWGLGFLLFRLFDISKPWPVRWAERRFAGGSGIMLDDLLAAGYALAALWLLRMVGLVLG